MQRLLDRMVDYGMIVSEIAITLMMVHISAELLVRWILRHGLDAVPEISAFYYMTALTFFALAYVTRGDGHISAQIFTDFLSPRMREILEGAILMFLAMLMALLTWQLSVEAVSMTRLGEIHQAATMNLPKWPGRWFLAIGSAMMLLYCIAAGAQKLIGSRARSAEPSPSP